jgi:hypothetical protein
LTDLYAEPLVGWRLWHIQDGRLVSWSQEAEWPAGRRLEASCTRLLRRSCDAAPADGHTCGLYAVRTRDAAIRLLVELPPLPVPVAVGQVSLWGRVFENVGGWRAQYAYPYSLEVLGGDESVARALRMRYRVDATALRKAA